MPGDVKVKKNIKKNIPRLVKKGYPQKQAVAIAFSEKRKVDRKKKKK